MTPTVIEMELLAREYRARMLLDAERERRARAARVDHPFARLLIAAGRWLEAAGRSMLVKTPTGVTGETR
jgi:hypothetical protein